jgi:hypothetical protein
VPNALLVPSLSSVSFIDTLPTERHSVHDIRLRFKTEEIWSTIHRTHPELKPNDVSKDLSLFPIQTYGMEAKTVVHHSDTVSVIVACSMKPVVVDHKGLIRLSSILTSVEERLLALVTGCAHTISQLQLQEVHIPDHNSWIATMCILAKILLSNMLARNLKSHGRMEKMPWYAYTQKI